MLLALFLLFGQRPLTVELVGPEKIGTIPHLRVILVNASPPATLEYEVWVESSQGPLAPEGNVELVLANAEGFDATPLPASGKHLRWRIAQKTEGSKDIPAPTVRWKGTDSTWHEHSWPDPLSLHASFTEAEDQPKAGIGQPRITLNSILIALGTVLAIILFTAWLSFRNPAELARLLDHPEPNSAWWNALHRLWHEFLAQKIEILPGTGPSDLVARWEQAGLPEPQTLLRLTRALEEFRFQPRPPDEDTRQAWIGDARAWIALVHRESSKKPE